MKNVCTTLKARLRAMRGMARMEGKRWHAADDEAMREDEGCRTTVNELH